MQASAYLALIKLKNILHILVLLIQKFIEFNHNRRIPLLRFHSALHCGCSGITDIQDGLFFVLTRARTFKKS
jgi:hypothetical protein